MNLKPIQFPLIAVLVALLAMSLTTCQIEGDLPMGEVLSYHGFEFIVGEWGGRTIIIIGYNGGANVRIPSRIRGIPGNSYRPPSFLR